MDGPRSLLVPHIIYRGLPMRPALVLGGADCVWDDAERAYHLFSGEQPALFLINDMISEWAGPADYFLTLHPEQAGDWLHKRMANCYPMGAAMWSHKKIGPAGPWRG